jgi:RNA polymerase sigma-70 factor (ECF subfamily)
MGKSKHKASHTDTALLVQRFQAGEREAFDEIVNRYRRIIYRMAYYFTHNGEDADDISQEVLLKVFRSLNGFRGSSTFDTWLWRITMNTCLDHLRKQPDVEALDTSSYTSYKYNTGICEELPDSSMEMVELRSIISKAVGRLPDKQKTTFILRHYEDLSLDEIAESLTCAVGTVKANLFHARRNLRELLSHYVS